MHTAGNMSGGWPAGFGLGSLYNPEPDAGEPAKSESIPFNSRVQLHLVRVAEDGRRDTTSGQHAVDDALEAWHCSKKGFHFSLTNATHSIEQAVSYIRGQWVQVDAGGESSTQRTFDSFDTFIHEIGSDGNAGTIVGITSIWRPQTSQVQPLKTVSRHPADEALAHQKNEAGKRSTGNTSNDKKRRPSSLRERKKSSSVPNSRTGSRRPSSATVSFGYADSYTIPGPDETFAPEMNFTTDVNVSHRGDITATEVCRKPSTSGEIDQSHKARRAARRKSLNEKRLSINSQDYDPKEAHSLQLLVNSAVENLSALESDTIRGALRAL